MSRTRSLTCRNGGTTDRCPVAVRLSRPELPDFRSHTGRHVSRLAIPRGATSSLQHRMNIYITIQRRAVPAARPEGPRAAAVGLDDRSPATLRLRRARLVPSSQCRPWRRTQLDLGYAGSGAGRPAGRVAVPTGGDGGRAELARVGHAEPRVVRYGPRRRRGGRRTDAEAAGDVGDARERVARGRRGAAGRRTVFGGGLAFAR